MPELNGQGAFNQHEIPVVNDAHRAPSLVLVFILKIPQPVVQHLRFLVVNCGRHFSAPVSNAFASRKSSAAAPAVLPLREVARAASQIANAESRSGFSNHFFNTTSRVKLTLPCSAMSSAIFSNFSGMFVRMKIFALFLLPQFFFQDEHLVAHGVAIAPANAVHERGQSLNPLPEARIGFRAFAQQQAGHFVQHGFQAVVERFVDVAEFSCELRAAFHIGQPQINPAGQIAGSFLVITNGFARFSQLELSIASRREELLHDPAPVFFERRTVVCFRLKSGVEKIAIINRNLIEVSSAIKAGFVQSLNFGRTFCQPTDLLSVMRVLKRIRVNAESQCRLGFDNQQLRSHAHVWNTSLIAPGRSRPRNRKR